MSLADGHQPSPADLYAEWKAFDLARERRVVVMEEAQPVTIVEELAEVESTSAVEVPVEPVDRRKACPCCGGSGREPEGVTESDKTGRRYAEMTTTSGNGYGLELGGRFIMVTAGGHCIEVGHTGRPNLDRFVDGLMVKLKGRAAAVERAKAMLKHEKHRQALDHLLQRLFRWPTDWASSRQRIRETVSGMGLKPYMTTRVVGAFSHPECRSTWNE